MPEYNPKRHLKVDDFAARQDFVSPRRGEGPRIMSRNRSGGHAQRLRTQLNDIRSQFDSLQNVELPTGIVRDDAIYVEFISEFDFQPAFDSLHSDAADPKYILLSVKEEIIENRIRYRVNVMLTEGGISHFIKRANEYISSPEGGSPRNEKLIHNLASIQLATLEAFWTEPNAVSFPQNEEQVWWEVWFRKPQGETPDLEKIFNQLELVDAQLGEQELSFPEHYVRLIKASPNQLSQSLLLLDSLAELRKPRETADYFTGLRITEKEEAVEDLISRIENYTDQDSLAICILDTGVQNLHPLLVNHFPTNSLFSHKPEDWGTYDTGGHGTGMAGLSLYGDLTDALTTTSNIRLYHQLESVKILKNKDSNNPELYGAITQEASALPIVEAPQRARIYCMAVTGENQLLVGSPSSWSTAIDKIVFGDEALALEPQLFIVSGGNVIINKPDDYLMHEAEESVHDPAQAFNVITVGGYTEFDHVDVENDSGFTPLAEKGGAAPANSNSLGWSKEWPCKPDIVMEAGNYLYSGEDISRPDYLKLLTTSRDFQTQYFQTFCDTSAATALASHLAAQLKTEYPEFWPETIRALIIHSAGWTNAMLNQRSIEELNGNEKRNLLRTFGYGVPDLAKARYSASNTLTLIAEKEIRPFQRDAFSDVHFFDLPWPVDVLQGELLESDVKLNVTLSYFIEPNPGSRTYGSKFSYQSHGFRFSVIGRNEGFLTFQKRINKNAREAGESGFSGESWILGERVRNKGSIHRDFWKGSGADLSQRNKIAVYPVGGWYRSRKKLEKYDSTVRYSLIVTVETAVTDVDIYTPVANLIEIEV